MNFSTFQMTKMDWFEICCHVYMCTWLLSFTLSIVLSVTFISIFTIESPVVDWNKKTMFFKIFFNWNHFFGGNFALISEHTVWNRVEWMWSWMEKIKFPYFYNPNENDENTCEWMSAWVNEYVCVYVVDFIFYDF
jgi:hypothetical protein